MKLKNIQNLPEYQGVAIAKCNLATIDKVENPLDILEDRDVLQQIFSINPATGFPCNDLDTLMSSNTPSALRDYLLRCIKRTPPLNSNPEMSDDDLVSLAFSRFDGGEEYVQRLQSFIQSDDEK